MAAAARAAAERTGYGVLAHGRPNAYPPLCLVRGLVSSRYGGGVELSGARRPRGRRPRLLGPTASRRVIGATVEQRVTSPSDRLGGHQPELEARDHDQRLRSSTRTNRGGAFDG